MTINDPATHAELATLYPLYEAALVSNDVATLTAMFWSSPYAIRLGAGENLYGTDEIEAFRDTANGIVRGRQSQVWVRLPEGWRIVSAHVSTLPIAKP
jgi:hypothetical protein